MGSVAWMRTSITAIVFLLTAASWAIGQAATSNPSSVAASAPASQPASRATSQAASKPAGAAAAAGPVSTLPPWAKTIKNPVPWFNWGFDERLRNEYLLNSTLDSKAPGHDTDYNRYRSRLWWTVKPIEDMEFNFRLTWEFRNYFAPESKAEQVTNLSDAIFDTMNIKWKNVMGLPLTVTAGRQDINLGNGWLVFEGTPDDGSRTLFFDGFRATYEIKEIQTTIDAMYVWQNPRENQYITPFAYKPATILTEQTENGAILYVTNKSIKNTEINGYFIYKDDSDPLKAPLGDSGQIYAFGNRLVHDFNKNWQYRGEWVEEVGNKNGDNFSAGGVNNLLTYYFRDPLDNRLRTGYEFLSDNFDPLWGRWPQWSEIANPIWAMEANGRPAYWRNMHRIQFGHTIAPIKNLTFATDYHLLFADANPMAGSSGFSDDGRFRGQLITWAARYKINDFFSTAFLAEGFIPGNYYTAPKEDTAVFLRYEFIFTF